MNLCFLSKVGKPPSLFYSHSGETQTQSAKASDLVSSRTVAAASRGSVTLAAVPGNDDGSTSEVNSGSRTCWPTSPCKTFPLRNLTTGGDHIMRHTYVLHLKLTGFG